MEYTQIKTYEDVCMAIGENPELLPDVSLLPKEDGDYLIAVYKATRITKAINGSWKADFGNHDQRKYFPWFYIEKGYTPGSGGGFSCHGYGCDGTGSGVGARLSFETSEKARYAANQFREVYEVIHLM